YFRNFVGFSIRLAVHLAESGVSMNALEEARALLPTWVPLANLGWVPLAFVLSLLGTWLGTAVALWPLRRFRGESWAARARLLYPGRFVSILCLLAFPVLLASLAVFFMSPVGYISAGTLAVLSGLAAYAGYLLVHIHCERRWRPMPLGWGIWLRGTLVSW